MRRLREKAVAFFSLEMSSIELVNRLLSGEAEIEAEKLKRVSWRHMNGNS